MAHPHLTRLFYAALALAAFGHVGLLAVQGVFVSGLEMTGQLEAFAACAGLEVFAGTSAFIIHRIRAHMAAAALRHSGYQAVNGAEYIGSSSNGSVGGYD